MSTTATTTRQPGSSPAFTNIAPDRTLEPSRRHVARRKAEVDDEQASTLLEALRAVLAELEDAFEA